MSNNDVNENIQIDDILLLVLLDPILSWEGDKNSNEYESNAINANV